MRLGERCPGACHRYCLRQQLNEVFARLYPAGSAFDFRLVLETAEAIGTNALPSPMAQSS